jgi:hypothetical protein
MPLSKNAQKYSFRRIGPRGPLPGGQGPPPAALKSLLPAANSTGCHLPKVWATSGHTLAAGQAAMSPFCKVGSFAQNSSAWHSSNVDVYMYTQR